MNGAHRCFARSEINPSPPLRGATIRPNVYSLIARPSLKILRGTLTTMTKLRLVLLATTALTAMQFATPPSHAQTAPLVVAQAKKDIGPDEKPKAPPKEAPRRAPPAAAPHPAPPAAAPPQPRPAPPPPAAAPPVHVPPPAAAPTPHPAPPAAAPTPHP